MSKRRYEKFSVSCDKESILIVRDGLAIQYPNELGLVLIDTNKQEVRQLMNIRDMYPVDHHRSYTCRDEIKRCREK